MNIESIESNKQKMLLLKLLETAQQIILGGMTKTQVFLMSYRSLLKLQRYQSVYFQKQNQNLLQYDLPLNHLTKPYL